MTIAFVAQTTFAAGSVATNPSCTSALTLAAGDIVEVHVLANNGNQPTSVQDGISGNTYTYKGATAVIASATQIYTYVCTNANAGSATISVTGTHVFCIKATQFTGGVAGAGAYVAGPISAIQAGASVGANTLSSGNAAVGSTAINILVSGFTFSPQSTHAAPTAGTSPLAFTGRTAVWAAFNTTAESIGEDVRVAGATGNVAATFGAISANQYDTFCTIVMVYQEAAASTPYSATIKAIAVVSGQLPSTVATAAYTITNPTSSVPAAAAAVGYNTKTFDSTTLNSSIGGLYKFNFFGQNPASSAIVQNSNGSLTLGTGASGGYAGIISTANYNASKPQYWGGKVFGGGALFRVVANFSGTLASDPIDMLYLFDILSSSGYTPENVQGYMGVEIDGFEMNVAGSTNQAGFSLHNYYYNSGAKGTANPTVLTSGGSPITIPSGSFQSGTHTYDLLWVPATGSTQGYLKLFFDGTQVGPTVYWNQYSAGQAFPPTGLNIGNIIDTLQLHFMVQSNQAATAVTVTTMQVFQASEANNATA